MGNKPKERKTKKKLNKRLVIYNILSAIFICIALGCGGYLAIYYLGNAKSEREFSSLKELIIDTPTEINVEHEEELYVEVDGKYIQKKFSDIYNKNNDFIGWLTINDTHIDYPVVQTKEDEEYYLRRNFEKQSATHGTLFVDASSNLGIYNPTIKEYDEEYTTNIIIYGHNMKAGTMFHDILKYEDYDFYKEHKTFTFDTVYEDGVYEVIAAFRSQIYNEEDTNFKYYQFVQANNQEEFDYYVDNCKRLTPYDTEIDAEYGDVLLTLSTCSYHTDEGRYVVVAKKIK